MRPGAASRPATSCSAATIWSGAVPDSAVSMICECAIGPGSAKATTVVRTP